MNVFFDKCSEALEFATKTKTFGIFHSLKNASSSNIHTHECCEILFAEKGGKTFLIDDKVYSINDGDMFIINQFEAHKITFENDIPAERYAIQIHPDFIYSVSSDFSDLTQCFYLRTDDTTHRLPLSSKEISVLKKLLDELSSSNDFGDDVIKKAVMTQVLAFVNNKFLNTHKNTSQPNNTQLKNALAYINEHLSDELTLELIAKNSYISVNRLCTLFKSTLGTTVTKYIIGKRISYAKKLLKTGYSVSDTAFACGFGDYSNFIRTFTKSVGISPGKYKKSSE